MNSRAEVVEGLDLVPVPPGSTCLKHGSVNEYVQLFNPMYRYNQFTLPDCGLPAILKDHGDPLETAYYLCNCDDYEDHICWLIREFCGSRGKHGRRRSKLVQAFRDAIWALENEMLQMYRGSVRNRKAGSLTPGLHKLATLRLNSLTNGIKRLQEYHDGIKVASSAGDDESDGDESAGDESSDDSNSDGSDEDLVDLERRIPACKASLLTPLAGVPNTKASIIKAAEDLKLAARIYDGVLSGPRSTVREYYDKCVLKVADAKSSLEHYDRHPICDGLINDLKEIDDGYRTARKDLYMCHDDEEFAEEELSDGLEKFLCLIWDETRAIFECTDIPMRGLSRPYDLYLDDDAWYSAMSELGYVEDPYEDTEDY